MAEPSCNHHGGELTDLNGIFAGGANDNNEDDSSGIDDDPESSTDVNNSIDEDTLAGIAHDIEPHATQILVMSCDPEPPTVQDVPIVKSQVVPVDEYQGIRTQISVLQQQVGENNSRLPKTIANNSKWLLRGGGVVLVVVGITFFVVLNWSPTSGSRTSATTLPKFDYDVAVDLPISSSPPTSMTRQSTLRPTSSPSTLLSLVSLQPTPRQSASLAALSPSALQQTTFSSSSSPMTFDRDSSSLSQVPTKEGYPQTGSAAVLDPRTPSSPPSTLSPVSLQPTLLHVPSAPPPTDNQQSLPISQYPTVASLPRNDNTVAVDPTATPSALGGPVSPQPQDYPSASQSLTAATTSSLVDNAAAIDPTTLWSTPSTLSPFSLEPTLRPSSSPVSRDSPTVFQGPASATLFPLIVDALTFDPTTLPSPSTLGPVSPSRPTFSQDSLTISQGPTTKSSLQPDNAVRVDLAASSSSSPSTLITVPPQPTLRPSSTPVRHGSSFTSQSPTGVTASPQIDDAVVVDPTRSPLLPQTTIAFQETRIRPSSHPPTLPSFQPTFLPTIAPQTVPSSANCARFPVAITTRVTLGIQGSIPTCLGHLTALTELDLRDNQLQGTIPSQLGQLKALTRLDLYDNHLMGTIPSQLAQLTSSVALWLDCNQLTGIIPSQLGHLTALTELDLRENRLTGPIPSELGQLTALTLLWLEENELTGTIPSQLAHLAALTWLDLYQNKFTGTIPSALGQLTALTLLWLEENELTGTIPSQLAQLTALTWLDLYNNQLTGTILSDMGQMTALTSLRLENNQLMGTIPSQLGQLTALTELDLRDNQLTGTIPPQLGQLTALTLLDLYNNLLTGTIPSELGHLTALRQLDLQSNQLKGTIPSHLGQLTNRSGSETHRLYKIRRKNQPK